MERPSSSQSCQRICCDLHVLYLGRPYRCLHVAGVVDWTSGQSRNRRYCDDRIVRVLRTHVLDRQGVRKEEMANRLEPQDNLRLVL